MHSMRRAKWPPCFWDEGAKFLSDYEPKGGQTCHFCLASRFSTDSRYARLDAAPAKCHDVINREQYRQIAVACFKPSAMFWE